MKIYIAGKITNDENYKEKFARAEKTIKERVPDVSVLNPAALPERMTRADYMRICFAMIESCDNVFYLPDSTESDGAKLELAYCEYIGKPAFLLKIGE